MVRRTKEEAQETRAHLLDAAERLFSEQGVTSTSLNDIARAAGVTRGALYHHFKNKTDLIEALLDRVMMPITEMRSCAASAAPGDPLSQIRLRAMHVLRQAVHDPHTRAVFTILFHKCEYVDNVTAIKQRHLETRNECAVEVQTAFAAAIAAGQLPADLDPRNATLGLFSFIDGLVYNWLLDPEYFSLDQHIAHFIDVYVEGLRHSAAGTARNLPALCTAIGNGVKQP